MAVGKHKRAMLDAISAAAEGRRMYKRKRSTDMEDLTTNNVQYRDYKHLEEQATTMTTAWAVRHRAGWLQRHDGKQAVLVSGPEFDSLDQPILATLSSIMKALEGHNVAGDPYDTFHQEIMCLEAMTLARQTWRDAWQMKTEQTLSLIKNVWSSTSIEFLTFKGGVETDWEQDTLRTRIVPSWQQRGLNISVNHFQDLGQFLSYVSTGAWTNECYEVKGVEIPYNNMNGVYKPVHSHTRMGYTVAENRAHPGHFLYMTDKAFYIGGKTDVDGITNGGWAISDHSGDQFPDEVAWRPLVDTTAIDNMKVMSTKLKTTKWTNSFEVTGVSAPYNNINGVYEPMGATRLGYPVAENRLQLGHFLFMTDKSFYIGGTTYADGIRNGGWAISDHSGDQLPDEVAWRPLVDTTAIDNMKVMSTHVKMWTNSYEVTGVNAPYNNINGVYKPMGATRLGYPVAENRLHPGHFLFMTDKSFYIGPKENAHGTTNGGWAISDHTGDQFPDEVPWRRLVDTMAIDKMKLMSTHVKTTEWTNSFEVTGVNAPYDNINGVYEPMGATRLGYPVAENRLHPGHFLFMTDKCFYIGDRANAHGTTNGGWAISDHSGNHFPDEVAWRPMVDTTAIDNVKVQLV